MRSHSHNIVAYLGFLMLLNARDQSTAAESNGKADNRMFDARKMIDALANSNAPPRILEDGDGHVAFPQNYIWSEQDRIPKVIATLTDHAEESWPELVGAIDDDRYSITFKIHDYPSNWTVGDVCSEIIRDYLVQGYYAYRIDDPATGGRRWSAYMKHIPEAYDPENKELKKWCQGHKDKKLYELQIAACEWAVNKISEYFPNVANTTKRKSIEAIKEEIKKLQQTKKPLHPECFYLSKRAMGEGGGPVRRGAQGTVTDH
jgi:hypothetical protein